MILLDANLLIALIKIGDAHHSAARTLIATRNLFSTSAIAWMEFHSRPVEPTHTLALQAILSAGILPFDDATAALAGQLFHATGSKRRTRLDTMIAASAIHTGSELATVNPEDFQPFVFHGLRLVRLG